MAAEPRRAPMMPLHELVDKYRALAGEFGRPVALSTFGLKRAEIERLFSGYDEDYHISRFFHFSLQPAADGSAPAYLINGFAQSHVALDAEIEVL